MMDPWIVAPHFYKSLQLDEHGNVSTAERLGNALCSVRAADSAELGRHRALQLEFPRTLGTAHGDAKYIAVSWWNTQWAFAGVRDPSDTHSHCRRATTMDVGCLREIHPSVGTGQSHPQLPVTVMAQAQRVLNVAPAETRAASDAGRQRLRAGTYGTINGMRRCCCQGDLKGAERKLSGSD